MKKYDACGRLATMEIFSHGESEARSDLSTNPHESTRTGIRENPCQSVDKTSPRLYTHDGNKNVSEAVAAGTDAAAGVVAHYDYAAFGAVVAQKGDYAETNPWRFSSEYEDTELGLDYYNYRHYEPVTGRWLQRDKNGDSEDKNLLLFSDNVSIQRFDVLGNECFKIGGPYVVETKNDIGDWSPWKNKVQFVNAIPHESVYPFWVPSLGLLTITVTTCECVYRYYELSERRKQISEHKKQKMYCVFGCPKTYMTYEDDLGWFHRPIEIEPKARSLGLTSVFKKPLTRGDGTADCHTTCLLGTPKPR